MNKTTSILIVEDDMIIGANLSMQLSNLGYDVTGIVPRGEEAIAHAKSNPPDILLLDINLKGSINGIETAKMIQEFCDVPIVYLTANSDEGTFEKAKETHPRAFITKPFNKLNLQRTIALVEEQLKDRNVIKYDQKELEVLDDRIFVRHNGKMEKLMLNNILYIEADRNYCTIVTPSDIFVLTCTLKNMEEKLNKNSFLRIHRSYIVNIAKVDAVTENHIEINRKIIPLGKSYRELLLNRIQLI